MVRIISKLVLCTIISSVCGWTPGCKAQEPSDQFASEQRVTIVDLVVDAPIPLMRSVAEGGQVQGIETQILVEGQAVPILEAAGERPSTTPWIQVLYFDAPMSAWGAIPWAAHLLGASLDSLLELGPVAIIVADPSPRWVLRPTSDSEILDSALSNLAFEDPGTEVLANLRAEYLEILPTYHETELDELNQTVRREEERIVTQRLDTLLHALTTSELPGPKRAVYWIGSGFEEDSRSFYPSTDATTDSESAAVPLTPFQLSNLELYRTLVSYGWTVLPMLRPPPEAPLLPGKRIGKLRVLGGKLGDAGDPTGRGRRQLIPVIGLVYEEDRDPEKARAFAELADVLVRQGDLESAFDRYRRALRFFHGDPRTQKEQCEVWNSLGAVLERLDRREEARRAFEQVAVLQETPVEGKAFIGRLRQPHLALEAIAESTLGEVIRGERDLRFTLSSLAERMVLSIQLDGLADGSLASVLFTGGPEIASIRYPGWIRHGTPQRLSEARVRLLLDSEILPEEQLSLDLEVLSSDPATLRLLANLSKLESPTLQTKLRLTLAVLRSNGDLDVEHISLSEPPTARTLELPQDLEDSALVVLLEDLSTGRWGAQVVESLEPWSSVDLQNDAD